MRESEKKCIPVQEIIFLLPLNRERGIDKKKGKDSSPLSKNDRIDSFHVWICEQFYRS